MCKKEVVIIGASGHGRVIADIIKSAGDIVLGFLDDGVFKDSKLNILGTSDDYIKYIDKYFIIAIGNNEIRREISCKLKNVKYYTAIHPFSFISDEAVIEEGCVVMPGSVINSQARIKKHTIINSNSTIEHDCVVGEYSHVSPGSVLCGTVTVGDNSWIGARSVIKNNISVCDNVVVGAGGVVVKNIEEKGTYIGVPVKKIK